jgi:hypothetical protein
MSSNMSVSADDNVIGSTGMYLVRSPPEQNTITHSNEVIQNISNKITPMPIPAILEQVAEYSYFLVIGVNAFLIKN